MNRFEQQRHRPPVELERPRELVLACAALRSQVNLSRIVRAAGACGVRRIICEGNPRLDREIARDAADFVSLEPRRTLEPALLRLREEGYTLVGLEQSSHSTCLYDFAFPRRTALVIGNERGGLAEETLRILDAVVEIPIYGQPAAHNVATATAMALYEYCRQWRDG